MYNTKNYTEQGGEYTYIGGALVIGGSLIFEEGGTVSGFPCPAATPEALGCVKQAANQAASTAADVAALKDDLNALLSKLKTAGIMAPDAETEG